MGINVRNSDIDDHNVSLYARLTLIPVQMGVGTGNRASFAQPRIGDRVAGGPSTNFTRDILGQLWFRENQPTAYY